MSEWRTDIRTQRSDQRYLGPIKIQMQISWVGWSTTCQSVRVLLLLTYKEQPWRLVTFEIRLMRKHDLTNIYFSLFVDNFLTILTIQRQSWRLATLETLITILTIENLNSDHLWDLAIKSDAGQHLQFLRCLWRWALKYYNKVPFTFSIFMYFRNRFNYYWFSFFRYPFKFPKTKLTLLMWPWHVMMVWQN